MKNEKFGPVRVGLLGIGTVGGGTFEVLRLSLIHISEPTRPY